MEWMRRWVPVLVLVGLTLGLQLYLAWRLRKKTAWVVCGLASGWLIFVVPFLVRGGRGQFSGTWLDFLMAGSLFWMVLVMAGAMWMALRESARFQPSRREFLAAAPVAALGGGIYIARNGMKTVEVELKIPGLARDLDGLRIAQLTDVHFGPFFGKKSLERAVAMANECRPHVAFVTGDLITHYGDDLEGCLRLLSGLKSEAGVLGCNGNHEMYSEGEERARRMAAGLGMRILRGESAQLGFGSAVLNVAGHDYQRLGLPALVGAERLIQPGALNLLLQHNPAVFERAVAAGFDVMLAGHTHGGQINVELFGANINLARAFMRYVKGKYEIQGKLLYVSSGLGTVAMPVRLGAPPEVTVIRLCAG